MATAALSIGAPDAATPARIALASPANDNARAWTAHPRAARLLASCIAHPPVGRWERARFGNTTDEWWTYTGYRFEALTAIYDAIGAKVHADYMAQGDVARDPFDAWCRQPRPTDAIDAALSAAARGEG